MDQRYVELQSAGYLDQNFRPTTKGVDELYRLLKLAEAAEAERKLHNEIYGRRFGGALHG